MTILHKLAARAKKYVLLILAVPLILGLLGWIVPAGKAPSSYKATTTVAVGSYNDPDFNYRSRVATYLTSASFYQKSLPDLWSPYGQNLFSRLTVSQIKSPLIQLTFSGPTRAEAADGANRIAAAFLAADKVQYQRHLDIVEQSITAAQAEKPDPANQINRLSFLYSMNMKKLEFKPAQLFEAADPSQTSGSAVFTPKKRSILGVMLGVTLSLIWLVLPELVRQKGN
jgi:Capsular polysaccharide biosynthesis protein